MDSTRGVADSTGVSFLTPIHDLVDRIEMAALTDMPFERRVDHSARATTWVHNNGWRLAIAIRVDSRRMTRTLCVDDRGMAAIGMSKAERKMLRQQLRSESPRRQIRYGSEAPR